VGFCFRIGGCNGDGYWEEMGGMRDVRREGVFSGSGFKSLITSGMGWVCVRYVSHGHVADVDERERWNWLTVKTNADILIVFRQPLALHSTRPLTGFMRTGYCEAPQADRGNHSVAGPYPLLLLISSPLLTPPAIVTNEFLDFSAARGNDLRQVGLTDGCKWCLCVNRWKEAFDARTGLDDRKVPKVVLKATNERALEGVGMEDLKMFDVDKD
jgi:uncharacterized protein (DUF2237 family)